VGASPARGILVPPPQRDLGMVFQILRGVAAHDVRQNVIYPLKHRKIARAEAGRKVDEVLELVGLSNDATGRWWPLSGGQMQRVALARKHRLTGRNFCSDEPCQSRCQIASAAADDLRIILKRRHDRTLLTNTTQGESESVARRPAIGGELDAMANC